MLKQVILAIQFKLGEMELEVTKTRQTKFRIKNKKSLEYKDAEEKASEAYDEYQGAYKLYMKILDALSGEETYT